MSELIQPRAATHKVIDQMGTVQFFYGQKEGGLFYTDGKPLTIDPSWAGVKGKETFQGDFPEWILVTLRPVVLENK